MPFNLLVPAENKHSIGWSRRARHAVPQFQLYAVEKWLVDRARHTALLLVYTGDPLHTVLLDELATDDSALYDAAIHAFRRDGAKPKQTPYGVLMATSLAHFRSDWAIVNIPNGDFAAAKGQLFANINLLRMGCSGRSALAFDEPSDATKDRFISLYHLPETSFSPALTSPKRLGLPTVRGKTKDCDTFMNTVLELVKLVQAGLLIFGYYSSQIDGLLCDSTLDAITRWMADIGEPLLGLDPSERVVDPMFISALFSLLLAVRNKLATLVALDVTSHQSLSSQGLVVPPSPPKDPFLFPSSFSLSLSSYLQAAAPSLASTTLTPQIIEFIDTAHESATRKRLKPVRKVLRSKLDEFPHARVDSEGDEKKDPREKDINHYNYRSGGENPPSAPASTAISPTAPSAGRLLALTSLTPFSGGLSNLNGATNDLPSFLSLALAKEKDTGPTFTGLHVRAHAQERRRRMGTSVSVIADSPSSSLKARTRESVDLGHFYHGGTADASPSDSARPLDTVVAGSVKALWSGRVAELVRLRENSNQTPSDLAASGLSLRVPSGGSGLSSSSWDRARSKSKSKDSSVNIPAPLATVPNVHSDGDVNHPKSDTDDDSEGVYNAAPNASQTTFGSLLGGKVKGKLGNWTALAKRRARGDGGGSVDLTLSPPSAKSSPSSIAVSPVTSREGGASSIAEEQYEGEELLRKSIPKQQHLSIPPSNLRPKPTRLVTSASVVGSRDRSGSIAEILRGTGLTASNGSGPQSPTLPPMIFASSEHPAGEDDSEMLSSGQISPLSDYRPNPFNLIQVGGSLSAPIGQSLANSTSNLLPSSSIAVQETASRLHSKLLTVTQRQDGRAALGKGKRPSPGVRRLTSPSPLPRITSWSDPLSARNILRHEGNGDNSDSEDERLSMEDYIEEEDEEGTYERGYGELDSDEPSAARTAAPTTSPKIKRSIKRPTLKRRNITSSIIGAGSDGELFGLRRGGREKTRFHSLLSVVDADGISNDAPMNFDEMGYYEFSGDEGEGEQWMRRQRSLRRRGYHGDGIVVRGGLTRRRSFHDLEDLRDMTVLAPERMRIDVEICGQVLVMTRREEHLKKVIACLKILNTNLSETNAHLRHDYESNLSSLSTLEARTKVLAALDTQNSHADKLYQSTNILRYEAEQFRVPDLWHTANLSRQKVFTLRHKVFGESGRRRLPSGAHGAHGRFNRLQRTIGGEERLVDYLGRTESEVEEEEALVDELLPQDSTQRLIDVDLVQRGDIQATIGGVGTAKGDEKVVQGPSEGEEEEEVVEHSSIRPMWLLQFFVGWGARWSARAATHTPGTATNASTSGTTVDLNSPYSNFDDTNSSPNETGPEHRLPDTPSIIIFNGEETRKDR